MDWSPSKIIRIEAGSVGISTNDLKALLNLYGIADASRTDELVELAKTAKEHGWWSKYREVLSKGNGQELLALIGYESAATIIRNFESLLVPGLLQTEEYARTVLPQFAGRTQTERADTDHAEDDDDEQDTQDHKRAEKLLEIRMERQAYLLRSVEPPLMFFVLDEAVVRREVGGRPVMRRQINRLLELAHRPYVTIEVVPFTTGAYPGLRGPFVVLEFRAAADDDVLYLENTGGDLIRREEPQQVLPYRETFEQLRKSSLGPEGTKAFLAKIASEMT